MPAHRIPPLALSLAAVTLASIASPPLDAQQRSSDEAIAAVFRRAHASVAHVRVWRRVPVSAELELVIALGSPKEDPFQQTARDWGVWSERRPLGLFLQDRKEAGRVFTLTVANGPEECGLATIVRATGRDTVISCDEEKNERRANHKFARWDRRTRTVKRFDIGISVGNSFAAVGDRPFVATDFGIVVIVGDDVTGYFVDRTTDGRFRLAEGLR